MERCLLLADRRCRRAPLAHVCGAACRHPRLAAVDSAAATVRSTRPCAILRTMPRALPVAGRPEDVLAHIGPGADVILPMANGEPVGLLDVLERENERLSGVRVHQMHALQERPYHPRARYGDRLRHVSYFLSPVDPPGLLGGRLRARPEPLLRDAAAAASSRRGCSVVLAAASPPDRAGYFSLGTNADYVASLIGKVPFFLEVNARMPRTFGLNQIHASQLLGYCERTGRSSRSRRPRPTSATARSPPHRRADPRRRDAAGRHRRRSPTPCSRRSAATATSASTPSCSRTGSSTSSRPAS